MSKKILFLSVALIIGASFFIGAKFALADDATSTQPSILNVVIGKARTIADINWNSGNADISSILYGTVNSADGINMVVKDSALTTSHLLRISNLTPGTKYYFKILSNSLTSNLAESQVYDFTTDGAEISNVEIKNITSNSALVTWQSSESDLSFILYGTENSADGINLVVKDNNLSTNHSLLISNLASNKKYYFQIQSNSLTSRTVESMVYDFITSFAQSSIISNVRVTNITSNSAVVNWSTVEPDISYLQYGLVNSDDGINTEARNNNIVKAHVLLLNNLQSGKTYYFRISANSQSDPAQNATTFSYRSGVYNFTTSSSKPFISEQIKCEFKFKGSVSAQKCYTAGDNSRAGCVGAETCVADISGTSGEKITWKSSCGGYGYSVIDGANENVTFYCADTTPGPVTTTPVISEKESAYDQISDINEKSKLLSTDKFDFILAELNQLRNIIKEQQTEIKYLKSLVKDVKDLSEKSQAAINKFITYGVDANTEKLGAGERAAVINSYKAAFDKLPETEAELADVIKIANGRWPSLTNRDAENQAKAQFLKIYKRAADMNDANDNAAVTVMAYGLRQKAENRNLNSEKTGIKIFKGIYGRTPNSTEDWNIMQAITYSGATQKTWSGYNPNGN